MPIDYRKYPKNWKTEIRPSILERDGHKCKFCGAPDRWVRIGEDRFVRQGSGEVESAWMDYNEDFSRFRPVVIVLTIAHLNDPDPMNVDPDNLAALCQRCHNRHDSKMRAENRKRNRPNETGNLFNETA